MEEIYKNFADNYAISNYGKIKNTITGKVLKLTINHKGYLKTNISIKGKLKTVFPHRLVAEAFIPNPNGLPQVNHIDECKTNNVLTNLEWCTNKYNSNYGTVNERRAEKNRKKVYQYDLQGNLLNTYNSTKEASFAINGKTGGISMVCNKKRKTYKGYKWKY